MADGCLTDNLRRSALLLANFGVARGIQVASPIVVAAFLPLSTYGIVEWAHAAATLASIVVMSGVATLVPLHLIPTSEQGKYRGSIIAASRHTFIISVSCSLAALIAAAAMGFDHAAVLVFSLVSALAGCLFVSTWFRAKGRMVRALYLEAMPFAVMAVAAACSYLASANRPLSVMVACIAGLACFFAFMIVLVEYRERFDKFEWGSYWETLRVGFPIMAGGLIAVLATVSGRLGAGFFGGGETAGIFASMARIAGLGIVIHQIVTISFYRALYALPIKNLPKVGFLTNVAVAVSGVALVILSYTKLPYFGPAFLRSLETNGETAVWLFAQVVVWSCASFNETLVLRCGVVSRSAVLSALLFGVVVVLALVLGRDDGFEAIDFAIWQTIAMSSIIVAQVLALGEHRRQFSMYWLSVMVAFGVVFSVGWACIL